jgi:hypothetical protein
LPVFDCVVGDKPWTYQCDPETVLCAAVWFFTHYMFPVKVKEPSSVVKKMSIPFIITSVLVVTIIFEN